MRLGSDTVQVELRSFNARQVTHELGAMGQRVETARPRSPDRRELALRVSGSCRPSLAAQQGLMA